MRSRKDSRILKANRTLVTWSARTWDGEITIFVTQDTALPIRYGDPIVPVERRRVTAKLINARATSGESPPAISAADLRSSVYRYFNANTRYVIIDAQFVMTYLPNSLNANTVIVSAIA